MPIGVADLDEGKGGTAVDRPRDGDVIMAAEKVLDRAYGRPGLDRSFHGFVGAYDLDKLNGEHCRGLNPGEMFISASALRIARLS